MTKKTEKQDGLVMRMVIAVCDKIINWILNHKLGISPYESQMFLSYGGYGWEDALMGQTIAHIKRLEVEEW